VQLVLDVIKSDNITRREVRQKNQANKLIVMSAKLIAGA
jgi:hypothetical protein